VSKDQMTGGYERYIGIGLASIMWQAEWWSWCHQSWSL